MPNILLIIFNSKLPILILFTEKKCSLFEVFYSIEGVYLLFWNMMSRIVINQLPGRLLGSILQDSMRILKQKVVSNFVIRILVVIPKKSSQGLRRVFYKVWVSYSVYLTCWNLDYLGQKLCYCPEQT